MDTAISVKNLSKTFSYSSGGKSSIRDHIFKIFKPRKPTILKALNDISFEVNKGEILGIIGSNGSGKSTLLNIILGSIKGDKKSIVNTNGKILRLTLGVGFDNNLTARDNIYLNGSIFGLSFKQIGLIFDEIIEFAGLEKFVDTPVKFFSRGMYSRLSFSVALHAKADIYLLDEFFGGVGDIEFRKKSSEAFKSKFLSGRTILFVSHNLGLIEKHCHNVMILDKGRLVKIGEPKSTIAFFRQMS